MARHAIVSKIKKHLSLELGHRLPAGFFISLLRRLCIFVLSHIQAGFVKPVTVVAASGNGDASGVIFLETYEAFILFTLHPRIWPFDCATEGLNPHGPRFWRQMHKSEESKCMTVEKAS